MSFVRTMLHTSLVCFHIDSKYEVKYGSRPFSLPYSFRVTDSRRNCSATTSRYRILILSQLPYEKEREVDGVRSKNLLFRKHIIARARFDGIITRFLYEKYRLSDLPTFFLVCSMRHVK